MNWTMERPARAPRRMFANFTVAACLAVVLLGAQPAAADIPSTALFDFLNAPDPSYTYSLVQQNSFADHTRYVLRMTSGTWRTSAEVNRTSWQHWVTVYVPHEIQHQSSMLLINSGSNSGGRDSGLDPFAGSLAGATGSVMVDLQMVPNQPLRFAGENFNRSEDALIAYSWKKFLETGDETWPAQLPMTRAAVRAMDTVQSFLGGLSNPVAVDDFIVAGASKRGWTTWLTAAADERVSAAIPIVIDTLNVEESFMHHQDAYGFWAPAVHDYVDAGIMDYMGTPELKALMDIVDPFVYRENLTMPKFILNAAGDQFFLPDSSQFYFDELLGDKYLRYIPNVGHGLSTEPAMLFEALTLYAAILNGDNLPDYSWHIDGDGNLVVITDAAVLNAILWEAVNPEARDFRIDTIGAAYQPTELVQLPDGTWKAVIQRPEEGWKAYFIEMEFANEDGVGPLKFTTSVYVIGVPEPTTMALAGIGLATLVACGYQRRKRVQVNS